MKNSGGQIAGESRLNRSRLALAAGVGAVGVAGAAVFQAGPGITGLPTVRKALFPRLSGTGRTDHVALTFDDGPDQATTPLFLEALAARGVRATFFLLGSRIAMKPRLAAQIAANAASSPEPPSTIKNSGLRRPRLIRSSRTTRHASAVSPPTFFTASKTFCPS